MTAASTAKPSSTKTRRDEHNLTQIRKETSTIERAVNVQTMPCYGWGKFKFFYSKQMEVTYQEDRFRDLGMKIRK